MCTMGATFPDQVALSNKEADVCLAGLPYHMLRYGFLLLARMSYFFFARVQPT